MPINLKHRERLTEPEQRELDDFVAHLKGFVKHEHMDDGRHGFGLPVGSHSGESTVGTTPINMGSQSFITNLTPGFVQMVRFFLESGMLNDVILQTIQNSAIGLSSGIVQGQPFELSELELEGANATPVTILQAPGSGVSIHPISMTLTMDVTDAYTNTAPGPTINIIYEGRTTGIFDATQPSIITLAKRRHYAFIGSSQIVTEATFDTRDKAIQVRFSTAPSGVGAMTAKGMLYYVLNGSNN